MAGEIDPYREYDMWQFRTPVLTTSIRYACELGAASSALLSAYPGAGNVVADQLTLDRWLLYTARPAEQSIYANR